VVDTAVLYAGLALGLGLYGGRAVSYLVAATTTWALNRLWTFRGRGEGPAHQQWALFLVVNLVGFAMNYGTYAVLIAFVPVVAAHPVLGVAAGAIAGMFGNFVLSRQLVFRARG
jgi:putative flippase GtrA